MGPSSTCMLYMRTCLQLLIFTFTFYFSYVMVANALYSVLFPLPSVTAILVPSSMNTSLTFTESKRAIKG